MQQILVYGDSLSWGIIPGTRNRHPFEVRWPGVLEQALLGRGRRVRVVEDCLNGRRTVWDDPFKPGRRGIDGIGQRIEVSSPLALVILMLGVNDFQSMHPHDPWHSAEGLASLVRAIRQAPLEPGMAVPPLLVVAPPPIRQPRGEIAPKFRGGHDKIDGLAEAHSTVADREGCSYFDAGKVVSVSLVDGVHLDADAHVRLGQAVAVPVDALLDDSP